MRKLMESDIAQIVKKVILEMEGKNSGFKEFTISNGIQEMNVDILSNGEIIGLYMTLDDYNKLLDYEYSEYDISSLKTKKGYNPLYIHFIDPENAFKYMVKEYNFHVDYEMEDDEWYYNMITKYL